MKRLLSFVKRNALWLILGFIVIFFLTFPMIMTYDSSHYMGYVEILEKKAAFSTWDIVRGPVFPILLFLSNFFFGKTAFGLVLFSLIFYLIALFISKEMLDVFSGNKKIIKYISYSLFMILFIFNIIIFGYFHTLLTEYIAISLSLVSCYLSWLLLITSFKENKKSYFLLGIYFILIVPFSWFLKQPYISISLFPLLISTIICIFTCKPFKSVIYHLAVFIICLFSLFVGIKTWNGILEYKGVQTQGSRSSSGMLEQLLIHPLENFEIIKDIDNKYIEDSKFLSNQERETINSNGLHSRVVEIYKNNGELKDQMVIATSAEGFPSVKTSIVFLIKVFFKHPKSVIGSYTTNYLGLINIYQPSTTNSRDYEIDKNFRFLGCQENCGIATVIGQTRNNIYYIPDYMFPKVADYEQSLNTPPVFRFVLNKLKPLSILSFNISLLILPFILVSSVLFLVLRRKKLDEGLKRNMFLVVILLGYSFLHVLMHAVTSAVIDRYASPAYTTTILGYIGFLSVVIKSFSKNKMIRKKKND